MAAETTREQLVAELATAPDEVVHEVLDFLLFLKSRAEHARGDTAVASESALAKDWLRPEEDAAWADL